MFWRPTKKEIIDWLERKECEFEQVYIKTKEGELDSSKQGFQVFLWHYQLWIVLSRKTSAEQSVGVGQTVLDAILGEKPKYKKSAQRKESSTQLRQIPQNEESVQKEESV